MNKLILTALLIFLSATSSADDSSPLQTKTKIKLLETKIVSLKQNLSLAQDRNAKLTQQLGLIEKEISVSMQKLQALQQETATKQQEVQGIEVKITALKKNIKLQQNLLAKQLRSRYMMSEAKPLKNLLNHGNLQATNRVLVFYQYLLKAQQQKIEKIKASEAKLVMQERELKKKYQEQQLLEQQLVEHQKKLLHDKNKSRAILLSLNEDIHTKQQTLTESLQNKNNLSTLLQSLTQASLLKNQNPLFYMNKKFPKPVLVKATSIEKLNQGAVFFVPEGTPVIAVSSGKVVFSNWLKGYGLLLIIDHGRGFMTLYAHNQSLLKEKDQMVNQGDQIALVGHTGGLRKNGLYFEIRQRGKAIPPLKWL